MKRGQKPRKAQSAVVQGARLPPSTDPPNTIPVEHGTMQGHPVVEGGGGGWARRALVLTGGGGGGNNPPVKRRAAPYLLRRLPVWGQSSVLLCRTATLWPSVMKHASLGPGLLSPPPSPPPSPVQKAQTVAQSRRSHPRSPPPTV